MNITPALPNPYLPPAEQERTVVAGVRAPNRTRDAVDQAERRAPPEVTMDQAERERIAAQAGALVNLQPGESARANRALASYAQVADGGERSNLRDLLGFDAYA